MKKIILYILSIIYPYIVRCQDSSGRIDERFLKTIVHITVPVSDSQQEVGTGFLIAARISNKASIDYLVTAKHMIGQYNLVTPFTPYDSIIVDFYSRDGKPVPITIPISDSGRLMFSVTLHPDPNVDVVIVNVSNVFNKHPNLFNTMCDTSYLQRLDSLHSFGLGFGSQVFAIGYPYNIMIAGTNEPIAKSGYIASSLSGKLKLNTYMNDKFNKIKAVNVVGSFFLVDGLIIGGNSGGPIINPKETKFAMVNGQLTYSKEPIPNIIIGIVSMVMQGGLAIAYSSDNIIDLIDMDLKNKYSRFLAKPKPQ